MTGPVKVASSLVSILIPMPLPLYRHTPHHVLNVVDIIGGLENYIL